MSPLETVFHAAYAAFKNNPSRENRLAMLFHQDRWDVARFNLPHENGVTVLVGRVGPGDQDSNRDQVASDNAKCSANAHEMAVDDRRQSFADRTRW